MIFITGPLYAGKREYARKIADCKGFDFDSNVRWDVQDLATPGADLEALAAELAGCEVVIATELGCGVVPVDATERATREAAGRLACLLAERAETVVRVFCGLPAAWKGEVPC